MSRARLLSVFLALCVLLASASAASASARTDSEVPSCDTSFFSARNVSLEHADRQGPTCGGHCCSESSEIMLRTSVRRDLEALLRQHAQSLHGLLASTAWTFQNHVDELVKQSENKTHFLFSQVYRRMSGLSKEPISALFSDIRNYINNINDTSFLNIESSVKKFFTELFPLVYLHAVNLQHKDFSEDYKLCLRRKVDDIQPFGDIPRAISTAMYKSSEATRVMLKALALGADVLNATDSLVSERNEESDSSQSSCHTALLKMMYCPKCLGLRPKAKPCIGYCLNVLRGCVSQQISELDIPWNGYVEAVEKLMIEVKTRDAVLNVDTAIKNLETRISEAIMYAMENGPMVEKNVNWACGNVKLLELLDPPRLAASENSSDSESNRPHRLSPSLSTSQPPPPDTQLLHFLASVARSKDYFSNLADTLCNDDNFAMQQDSKECWNGKRMGEYSKTVVLPKASFQKYNPEVESSSDSNNHEMPTDNRVVILSEKLRHMRQIIMSQISVMLPTAENHMQGDEAEIFTMEGSGSGIDDDTRPWGSNIPGITDEESGEMYDGSGSGHGITDEPPVPPSNPDKKNSPPPSQPTSGVQRISVCCALVISTSLFVFIQSCARKSDILL